MTKEENHAGQEGPKTNQSQAQARLNPISNEFVFHCDKHDTLSNERESFAGLGILNPDERSVSRELAQIPENATNGLHTDRAAQNVKDNQGQDEGEKEKVLKKLSPSKIHELTSSPESLSLHAFPDIDGPLINQNEDTNGSRQGDAPAHRTNGRIRAGSLGFAPGKQAIDISSTNRFAPLQNGRPELSSRTLSTPPPTKKVPNPSTKASSFSRADTHMLKPRRGGAPAPLPLDAPTPGSSRALPNGKILPLADPAPSPMPPTIPLPPLSMPTYLQLELSSSRPSPLYIHRSATSDFPYESSSIKFERLQNFLLLPPNLEGVLWFGALACLDAWLYSFTILPLRFVKAVAVLGRWWGENAWKEIQDIGLFIYLGTIRMWNRRRSGFDSAKNSTVNTPSGAISRSRKGSNSLDNLSDQKHSLNGLDTSTSQPPGEQDRKRKRNSTRRHRRTKSTPSALLPSHKADILKGLVVLFSCIILTRFDASRMYHGIRGQAAIKLYVIYNVLEVCDRLFSALGQDVFECLFSRETLDRNPDGRSKLLRPFGMFLLALTYNVIHSTALFYQVITLNVAVNSYSNALLTLLMSNQFVEIKSTVFKKFEKENLFQLTCADVVERFQLWLMLMIIALRNLVEVGLPSLSFSVPSPLDSTSKSFRSGILPKSFTLFPEWSGQLFGPFFLVLGSEMLVDWLKHAYITKFNNTKPAIYGRFLDVLAKDYYSNAFADQNLTKRLGLPVIPLSCLFLRASLQTYHMFLATHMPLPSPSTATSLAEPTTSPETTAALQHVDAVIRRALGRSSFGGGATSAASPGFPQSLLTWTADDLIALATLLIVFLLFFLVLLAIKLVLGMCLLSFARRRYKGMKEREGVNIYTGGRRVGGWGVVEVDEDKRRWIYADDPEGMRAARERERVIRDKGRDGSSSGKEVGFSGVSRYTMVAKRIW
ncbi:MAG: hypothetical protein M1814_005844 [Vezdaea aestivalis]|nr:MAG: hypothetical protein M1814_005844 [Vezdaea aestivalis]